MDHQTLTPLPGAGPRPRASGGTSRLMPGLPAGFAASHAASHPVTDG